MTRYPSFIVSTWYCLAHGPECGTVLATRYRALLLIQQHVRYSVQFRPITPAQGHDLDTMMIVYFATNVLEGTHD